MIRLIKLSTLLTCFFVAPIILAKAGSPVSNFDTGTFYAAMAGSSLQEVNIILTSIKDAAFAEKEAYEGALLMKKAGLVSKPKDKLSNFKLGRTKLEAAIKNDPGNIEYHFLRLIIQEHVPKIVNYRADLKADAELIRKSLKKLSPPVKQAVKDFSKNSKFLKAGDF